MKKYCFVLILLLRAIILNAQTDKAVYPYRTLYVVFLMDIFKSDYPDGGPQNPTSLGSQTTNLLKYASINHFSCIMINDIQVYHPVNKIKRHCDETINGYCAGGVIPEGYGPYLALFIKTAEKPISQGGYGLKSIGAEVRELGGDELFGDVSCCMSDIDEIIKFDKQHTDARIDQIDIDYEFDLPQYSSAKSDNPKNNTNVNGYNYNLDPYCNCNEVPANIAKSHLFSSNEYVAFGFRQLQRIINHARDERSKNPHTIDTICFKIEDMEQNFVDDGSIPPMKLNPNSIGNPPVCRFPRDGNLNHCSTTTDSRQLTQSIYFATWMATHCDKLGLDFTTADATSCGQLPKDREIMPDSNGCIAHRPDYFINGDEDMAQPKHGIINPPTINDTKPYYPFSQQARRERMLDYFGSVKTDHPIKLLVRVSTQPRNPQVNYAEGMGDWMTQENNWDCNSKECKDGYICCDKPHYIPEIENEFLEQFNNSYQESFNQYNSKLPNEGSYYYDEHYKMSFNHQQKENEPFWGMYNNIIIEGFGWYRYGFYPLVPDNNPSHGYITTNPDCYCDPKNPNYCAPICKLNKDRSKDAEPNKPLQKHH